MHYSGKRIVPKILLTGEGNLATMESERTSCPAENTKRRPMLPLDEESDARCVALMYRCSGGRVFFADQRKQSRETQERNRPRFLS